MTLRTLSRRAPALSALALAALLGACTMPKKPENIISINTQQDEEAPTIQIDLQRPAEPHTAPTPGPALRTWPGGDFDRPLQRLNTPAPGMPAAAIDQDIQGRVILDLIVDEDGRVSQSIVINSAHPVLTQAARDVVRGWTFKPMTVGGKPVHFRLRQPFRFVLAE